jgi:hypothetical protein
MVAVNRITSADPEGLRHVGFGTDVMTSDVFKIWFSSLLPSPSTQGPNEKNTIVASEWSSILASMPLACRARKS